MRESGRDGDPADRLEMVSSTGEPNRDGTSAGRVSQGLITPAAPDAPPRTKKSSRASGGPKGLDAKALKRLQQQAKAEQRAVEFRLLCKANGLPMPTREVRFHATRLWRLDFAWEPEQVALEVEGGIWLLGGGRHNRGKGYEQDLEKYNHAVLAGWKLLRVTPTQLCTAATLAMVRALLT